METRLKVIVSAVMIGTWGAFMAAHGAKAEQGTRDDMRSQTVRVYENGPGSGALLAGDTQAAIRSAEKALRLPQPFPALVNLCAAHILAGDLPSAERYCERAVEESGEGIVGGAALAARHSREARALAKGNLDALRAYQQKSALAQNSSVR